MSPPAAGNTRVLLNAVKLPVLLVSDAVLKFKLCVCVCVSVRRNPPDPPAREAGPVHLQQAQTSR